MVYTGFDNHWNEYVLQRIFVHMWSSGICGVCCLETAVILSK